MKTFMINIGYDEDVSQWDTHYIDCNIIEHTSAFAVKIENQFTIVFMHPIARIEVYREVIKWSKNTDTY